MDFFSVPKASQIEIQTENVGKWFFAAFSDFYLQSSSNMRKKKFLGRKRFFGERSILQMPSISFNGWEMLVLKENILAKPWHL